VRIARQPLAPHGAHLPTSFQPPSNHLPTTHAQNEEARLESRRTNVRERIARQHEIAAKLMEERVAAETRAREEVRQNLNPEPQKPLKPEP
jgi:hypothetical protein